MELPCHSRILHLQKLEMLILRFPLLPQVRRLDLGIAANVGRFPGKNHSPEKSKTATHPPQNNAGKTTCIKRKECTECLAGQGV